MRRSNRTATDFTPLLNQREDIKRWQTIFRRAYLDELPVRAEELQVFFKRHARGGDGADDEVEGAGVVFSPVGVFVCGDEFIGAEGHGVGFFGGGARDGCYAVCAEGFGVEDAEVAEAADADDADFFAGAAAVVFERGVGGDAAAEHGGGFGGGDAVGDFDDEVGGGAAVVGVASVGLAAVAVFAVVGAYHARAVVFHPAGTFFALGLEAGA